MTNSARTKISNAQSERWAKMPPREKKRLLKKMAAGKKKAAKLKKGKVARGKVNNSQEAEDVSQHAVWLSGYFQGQLEQYARSNQIPISALAQGVIGLLRHSQVR